MRSPDRQRNLLGRSLVPHAVLLWALLNLLALVVGIDRAVFDADEGALVMQVQVLDSGQGWFTAYPPRELDPNGEFVAVSHALVRDGEIAPFPVRPALVVLTTAAWTLGGALGATQLGIVGVVAASYFAALLAAQIDPRSRLLAFWLAGAASPLAFHALVLRGHGAVAGLAGAALWLGIRSTSEPARRRWVLLLGSSVFGLVAASMRREVLMFAAAVLLATAATAIRERSARPLAWPAPMLAGAFAGVLIDHLVVSQMFNTEGRSLPTGSARGSMLSDRLQSLTSFIQPGFEGGSTLAMALIMAAVAVAVVTAVRYLRVADVLELTVGTSITAGLLIARLVLDSSDVVQGLVPAFPLGVAAFVLATPHRRSDPTLRLLVAASVIFMALIALTQYPFGGGFEWGSRYLATGLVTAVPVAAIGLIRTWDGLDARAPRPLLAGAVAVAALAPSAMGFIAQHEARANNASNIAAGYDLADRSDSSLIISTHPQMPRVTTDQLESDHLWLWAWPESLPALIERVEAGGHDTAVLFTRDLELTAVSLEPLGWELVDVSIRPDNPGSVALGVIVRANPS